MASAKDVKRTPSGRITYRGESFPGFNKPKRTPGGPKKSAVLAKKGTEIKLVRFGDPNMTIKKINQDEGNLSMHDINVLRLKINLVLGIGLVRLGNESR